ncbi:hypothetical protein Tco_0798263 [Tanacetum coccineum]
MPPKRTSTSEAPAMTQAAIKKLVADSVSTALEAQAATMANADNTNRTLRKKASCSKKVFFRSNCTEDCKVKFATGTLIEEALSWWNSFDQPIGTMKKLTILPGEKGHYANQYRKTTNNNAQGRAYMLKDRNAHQDPNIVMGGGGEEVREMVVVWFGYGDGGGAVVVLVIMMVVVVTAGGGGGFGGRGGAWRRNEDISRNNIPRIKFKNEAARRRAYAIVAD